MEDSNSKKMCRTCLTERKNMFDLFIFTDSEDVSLVDMLTSCAAVEVNSEDSLPNLICVSCVRTLTTSYNFKKQCERSDKLLRTLTNNVQLKQPKSVNVEENTMHVSEEVADEEATSEYELSEHEWKYEESTTKEARIKKYMCVLCDKSFMKLGNLKHHMKTHNARNECTHCGIKCESYKALLSHNREQHKVFKCQLCDKGFSTGNALNGHMRYHSKVLKDSEEKSDPLENLENAEYICVVGESNNLEQSKSDDIRKSFHGLQNAEIIAQKIEGEGFSCTECEYRFVTAEELNAHIKIHDSVQECSKCDLKFPAYNDLSLHNKEVHNIYNCKICSKNFITSYALSGHMRHHVTVDKGSPSIFYKCTINNCTKKFSTLDYLRRHTPSHENAQKVFLCNLCGKIYNSNNSFYYHLKMHKNERPYVCSYCGSAYKLMCHLKNHLWNHTGVRPYECKKCGKRFTRRRVLKKHIATNCGSKKRRKPPIVDLENLINEEVIIKNEVQGNEIITGEVYENDTISDETYVEDIEFIEAV